MVACLCLSVPVTNWHPLQSVTLPSLIDSREKKSVNSLDPEFREKRVSKVIQCIMKKIYIFVFY